MAGHIKWIFRTAFAFWGGYSVDRWLGIMLPTENPWFWFTSACFALAAWIATEFYWYRKARNPAVNLPGPEDEPETETEIETDDTAIPVLDEDEEAVRQNPGNHYRVIRCMKKAETLERLDELFGDYLSARRGNKDDLNYKDYDADVAVAHFFVGIEMQPDEKGQGKWWFERRNELKRLGFTEDDFNKAATRWENNLRDANETP